jgi:hypothetical protein
MNNVIQQLELKQNNNGRYELINDYELSINTSKYIRNNIYIAEIAVYNKGILSKESVCGIKSWEELYEKCLNVTKNLNQMFRSRRNSF